MKPPVIRTTLLPKMLEQQQGDFRPEHEAQHGPPGKKRVCLATLSLRIHEPSRETFIRNHVRILLEKQVIFSLGYYENIF